jgi:nucleoid-associated protein YgaU
VLLIAIGVIVYMGMKMMSMQNQQNKTAPQQQVAQKQVDVKEEVKKALQEQLKQIQATQQKPKSEGLKKEEIAAIVSLVMAQMQQNRVSQPKAQPKEKENQVDSKLKALIDEEGSTSNTKVASTDKEDSELDNVLSVLESVDVDSVEEENNTEDINLDSLEPDSVKAKEAKDVPDTFNKVIVKEQNNTKDELGLLGGEIEQLVKKSSKEVKEKSYEKKMKQEVKERKNEMRIIVVRRGDTLSMIAKRAYGSGKRRYYWKILRANPGLIKNPNRIFVGQRLRVPK